MKRYIFSFIIALLTYTGVSAQLPVADLVDIVFQKDGSVAHIPVTDKSEVYDVSGAGDTCVATVILGLAAGVEPVLASRLSNEASGIAVRKMGTAVVSADELRSKFR